MGRRKEAEQPVSVAATRIVQAALKEDVSVAELSGYATTDPGFAVRVIAYVNNPVLGLGRRVDDVRQACNLLGLRGLRNLALGLIVSGLAPSSASANDLLANCIRRSLAARALAKALKENDPDTHFTVGLFLDVGLLSTAKENPELAENIGLSPAAWRPTRERLAGLVPHPIRGCEMARDLGLSESISSAILHHHDHDCPADRAQAIAWLAERVASVFEGGDVDHHREIALAAGQRLGLAPAALDQIIAELPTQVVAFASTLDRDVGHQMGLEELQIHARESLAALNAQYETLVRSLESIIADKERMEVELRSANERLETLASTDGLTGLYNRRAISESLIRDLARADRDNKPLSVIILDVDRFKSVNDTHGHQVGDAVLTMVGAVLRQTLRVSDVGGRYGGEEFLCILPATDHPGALVVAERLRVALPMNPVPSATGLVQITASFGVATVHGKGCRSDSDALVRRADEALYQAKHQGRDRVVGHPDRLG